MKSLTKLVICATLATIPSAISAQPTEEPAFRAAAGGGEVAVGTSGPCLDERRRRQVRASIRESVSSLQAQGRIAPAERGTAPQLSWPLRAANGLLEPGFHGVSNFVDQDPLFPGFLQDYACGSRTYDLSDGYNHRGVDYFTWPYPFRKMDLDQVEIVAAAPGTIVFKEDGNHDRNCSLSAQNWNAVYVMHGDGSVAWYGHMKNGSLTPKGVGETVARGEYLGVVGSSGSSTAPHLHFELYDSDDRLQEPYSGPCNALNGGSWWIDQRPYYDSAINELTAGTAEPFLGTCPNQGNPNERTIFDRGETIYFTAYYRDQLNTLSSNYVVRRPNGTVFDSWTHAGPQPHYAGSYWYWFFENFAFFGPDGEWTFEVTFNGQTVVRPFTIGGAPAGRIPGSAAGEPPLRLDKAAGAAVLLEWSDSCLSASLPGSPGDDSDYAIYSGSIGNWYDHTPKFCTTFSVPSLEFVPAAGSRYFLLVPLNGTREGSYGWDGAGAERPAAAGNCMPQELGSCP